MGAIELTKKHFSASDAQKLFKMVTHKEKQLDRLKEQGESFGETIVGHMAGFGVGYAIGQMESRYAGETEFYGVPLPLGLSIMTTGAAMLMTKNGGFMRRVLLSASEAGVTCYGHSIGHAHGSEALKARTEALTKK